MILVYQVHFPSGTPGRSATGHIPVWAPSWLPFGFIPVFSRRGGRLFGKGSNVRYFYLIELIFGFSMVFIVSIGYILKKLWYLKAIGYKVQNISLMA